MPRRALALAVLAAAGFGAPAQAGPPLPQPVVVYEVDAERGYVRVGSAVGRQPLVGAWVDASTGEACAGFSFQVPQCVQVGPIELTKP